MKFYFSSYGKSFNNDLGCGTVVKNDDNNEWSRTINADNLFFNQGSLFAFNNDLSNVYSLKGTFHSCSYLHDIDGIAGGDDSFNNCYSANWAFAGFGRSYSKTRESGLVWKWKFPQCTDIHHMFLNCVYAVKEFKNGCFPSAIQGTSAFENTNIENFTCDLPSLQIGGGTFYLCKHLRHFDSNLGSLITGKDMFTHSKLSYVSIQNIYNKIKTMTNWKTDFADGASGNVHPSWHPFAGLQKYKLLKSGSTITYVRVFFHPHMTQWCNISIATGLIDPETNSNTTLICRADNFKDCVKWWKKNPKDVTRIMAYSTIPADWIGKLTIGYDGADSKNSTSAINDMKAKFAAKGWTVTFIKN